MSRRELEEAIIQHVANNYDIDFFSTCMPFEFWSAEELNEYYSDLS
ncbi:hypothetical protein EDC52_101781 [Biostraticola tofi]|uniref:Uncharacterized protein n=1 Tax=Biostraticola tofi TaxID=466109 RepID=A0A4R3Z855_9GAMM|nr:hypothetical protein EDC52_101781 [Biostraticola tofi]